MKVTIPTAGITEVAVGQVNVGELTVGPISVGRLEIDSLALALHTGTARLENVRVDIILTMSMDWSVHVDIWPFGTVFSTGGTVPLGAPSVGFALADVTLPGLDSLDIDAASLAVENLQLDATTSADLDLGPITIGPVAVNSVVAPVPDATLSGLSLGSISVAGLGVPAASVENVTVGTVTGAGLPIAAVTIPAIALPRASTSDITSTNFSATADAQPLQLVADLGVVSFTLDIRPSASLSADRMSISQVSAGGSIGDIVLQNVTLPYNLVNLTLADLGITTISVPSIEVG